MSSPVYVDELFVWPAREYRGSGSDQAHRVGARNGHKWCHMWSDDLEALHAMAKKIGMKRQWFQDKVRAGQAPFPHYDLVPGRRAAAIAAGAIVKSLIDWKRKKPQPDRATANYRCPCHGYVYSSIPACLHATLNESHRIP